MDQMYIEQEFGNEADPQDLIIIDVLNSVLHSAIKQK